MGNCYRFALVSCLLSVACARQLPSRVRDAAQDAGTRRPVFTGEGSVIERTVCEDGGCACTPNAERDCYDGNRMQAGVGICKRGRQRCLATNTVEFQTTIWSECEHQGEPEKEDSCGDSLDNDCDGNVDEGCPCTSGATESCSTACGRGERACRNGAFGRCEVIEPPSEVCNGKDDDCDGTIDELDRACSSKCGEGKQSCFDGEWSECSAPGAVEEACNGKDDDCDGATDEISRSCMTRCGEGEQRCTGGRWSECAGPNPAEETCNGEDDDCDGSVDELSRPCSTQCAAGEERCVDGRWSQCSGRTPVQEICNGRDDDCDGTVDDIARDCSNACGAGSQNCSAGMWSSCDAPQPAAETCDATDEDCDGIIDEDVLSRWSFENLCQRSRVFIVVGGCNVCAATCEGNWVEPGAVHPIDVPQQTCFEVSAFARTASGDVCLDADSSGYVGQVRTLCNIDCLPEKLTMAVTTGGC